jgi:Lon protease-like protein
MVTDAAAGTKTIGMVLLKPGFEADYAGRPPIYELGCAGTLERSEQLPDGRFNILLRGLSRFRVREEHPGASYRIASVEALPEAPGEASELAALHPQLLASIGKASDGPAALVMQSELAPDVFVNALCQTLALAPIERQSLLDCDTTLRRGRRLLEILQWKALEQVMGKGQAETVH